jgi:diguanylate cyclase (GGDEF)-like protein
MHDLLTSLPNRILLEDRLRQAMLQADRRKCRLAVMVLNLDRFKSINDSLGREAGDRLLCDVARRLSATIREMDTLARHGSDEFVLLATDIGSIDDTRIVANKIIHALSEPLMIGTTEIYPDASIGVSLYPDNGSNANELLLHSDAAMMHAKELGGRQAQFFAPAMNSCTLERFELTNELRRAVGAHQLLLRYQPKMEIATGVVRGVEALLRWQHPTRGLLMPDSFLALAEETGMIHEISAWVLTEACRQAAEWQSEDGIKVRVAVNLSAHQFKHDLRDQVRRALEASNLAPGYLKLELTESALIQDPERAAATLRELRKMGVCTSVDDFGVNCSCLSYLRRFPLDELKIDRSFVATMIEDPANGAIVRAIIALAHGLGLKVVAEGVETMDQLRFLAQLRCDKYQGGLCSGPLTPEELVEFVGDINATLDSEEVRGADAIPPLYSHPSYGRAAAADWRPYG